MPPANTSTSNVAQKKRKFPKWLLITIIAIVTVLAFVVGAGIWAFLGTEAPKKVSDQFVNYIQSSDNKSAYNLTSATFKAVTNEKQFETFVKSTSSSLQGDEKITDRGLSKSTGNKDAATFIYEVENSGKKYYIKVQLQKEADDTWQVIYIESGTNKLTIK